MDNELFHNNLTFLSRYIHLFNGKKIIHVAQSRFYDPDKPADHNNLLPTKLEQSDQGTIEKRILPLAERLNRQRFKGDKRGLKKTLMDLFDFHRIDTQGIMFHTSPNHVKLCESVPFQNILLPGVNSDDPNEITFYCHSKGITHEGKKKDAVKRWTKYMYQTNLDDIDKVEHILRPSSQFGCLGTLKILSSIDLDVDGIKTREPVTAPWHYSGTFFWFNNYKLFQKSHWKYVPESRWGVECYLSQHFKNAEAYCLGFGARSGADLYKPRVWDSIDKALDSPPLPKRKDQLPFHDTQSKAYQKEIYGKQVN